LLDTSTNSTSSHTSPATYLKQTTFWTPHCHICIILVSKHSAIVMHAQGSTNKNGELIENSACGTKGSVLHKMDFVADLFRSEKMCTISMFVSIFRAYPVCIFCWDPTTMYLFAV